MSRTDSDLFATACSELVGRVALNRDLAEALVRALAAGDLTQNSGPVGINKALKGYSGSFHIKAFLKSWRDHAEHLTKEDVTATFSSALKSYRLAEERAHRVDAVWTGPAVKGSEVRRTEAVVSELVEGAKKDLLIVGYWLVTDTNQIRELISSLISKARSGVRVRFVLDPGEKTGKDNFSALAEVWPAGLDGAHRGVYSWGEGLETAVAKSGASYDRKLHAKVIVADRRDALVTSANLTHSGMLENLEMGLRVQGSAAQALAQHFDLLIDVGVLEKTA